MSHDENEEVRLIAALWLERFGEPPAMLTDADLMWRVLRSMSEGQAVEARPASGRFNYL